MIDRSVSCGQAGWRFATDQTALGSVEDRRDRRMDLGVSGRGHETFACMGRVAGPVRVG